MKAPIHKKSRFDGQGWHKAGGASPLGVARAACFEELAGVFASSGALLLAKIAASLKIRIKDNPGWLSGY